MNGEVAEAEADLAADVAAAEAEKAAGEANANRDVEVAEANAELLKSNLKALATAVFNDAAADARLVLAEVEAAAKVLAAAVGVFGPDAPGPLPSAGQQGEPSLRQKPGVATEGSYHQSPSAFSQQGCSADIHTWHPYDHYYQEYEEVDPFEHWYDYGGSGIFELLHAMGLDAEAYQTLIQTAAAPPPVSMPPGGPWKCAMSEGTSGTGTTETPAETPMAAPASDPLYPGYQGAGSLGREMNAVLRRKFIDEAIHAPPTTENGRLMSKVKSEANRERLAAVLWEIEHSRTLPLPVNYCHRWVQELRNRIVALGREYWDNDEYKIYWVDWNVDDPTWEDHGGLMIVFADGSTAYIDNGVVGNDTGDNDHVFFPEDLAKHPEFTSEYQGKLIGLARPHIGLFTGWSFRDTPLGKFCFWIDEYIRRRRLGDLDTTICP